MIENTEKSVFLRCFSHELSDEEINSLSKEDIFQLIKPSSFNTIHDTNRVLEFDAILETLIKYYNLAESKNGYYIVLRSKVVPSIKDTVKHIGKRYQYHGGGFGLFDGYFTGSDRFYRYHKEKTPSNTIDSIPHYNMAHFFCDYLNTDDKTEKLVDWLFSDDSFNSRLKTLILNKFRSK